MLVIIKDYLTLPEATAMQALLESENIPCFLKDSNTSVIAPFLANILGGIKLMVNDQDAERAIILLKDAGYIKPETENENSSKGRRSLTLFFLLVALVLLYFIVKTIPH